MNESSHPDDASARVHRLHPESPERPFDIPPEQIERIIARASVLQNTAGETDGRRLSPEELVTIGREVGLSAEFVRRAIAEYRADALAPPAPQDHPLLEKALGPAHVRVRRVIRGTPEAVHRDFEQRMREDEVMQPVRRRSTESVWRRDSSLMGKLQRGLDFSGREYELVRLESVEMAAAPASDDSALVTLTADMTNIRKDTATGWAVGAGVVWLVLTYRLLEGTGWGLLSVPALVASAAGAAIAIRMTMANRRRRVGLVMEGVLDRLEARRGP